jgi:hypothetical protein
MKLKELLPENNIQTHSYGCVMLYFDFPDGLKLQDAINPAHIYEDPNDTSYGHERDFHCTLLYGLHDTVSVDDVNKALGDITFSDCRAYNPSLFKTDRYDVLKYDVGYRFRGGAFLTYANNALKKYPYSTDYPDYHPHMTMTYCKPGFGQKYADLYNRKAPEHILKPMYVVYSQPDGTKTKIKINLK